MQSITKRALQLFFKLGDDGYNRSHHPAGDLEGPQHLLAQNLALYPLQKRLARCLMGTDTKYPIGVGLKTLSLRTQGNNFMDFSEIKHD